MAGLLDLPDDAPLPPDTQAAPTMSRGACLMSTGINSRPDPDRLERVHKRLCFSPIQFLATTVGLSDAECGIYWRARALAYIHGGSVRVDHLQAVSGSHGHTFNAALARLVEMGKLIHRLGRSDKLPAQHGRQ